MRIGIIISKYYDNDYKIKKLIETIRDYFGQHNATIVSPNHCELDRLTKKYALEMGLDYIEFNPAYTGHNMYSYEKKEYYEGKNWHYSQIIHRFTRMFRFVDKLFIFTSQKEHDALIVDIMKLIPKKLKIQKIHENPTSIRQYK
jgi:hypothetical protein